MAFIRKPTIDDVIVNSAKYENTGFSDYEKTCRVELVNKDEHNIPRLHFTWRQKHSFYNIPADVADALKQIGFTVEEKKPLDGSEGVEYALDVIEKRERHLWLMNFRRYSWSYTNEAEGEYGYGGGQVYANGNAVAFLASSPADVVRDSLVFTWAEIQAKEKLPKAFFCAQVEAALRLLLDDAVANVTEHARPDHNSGIAVSTLPGMLIDVPRLRVSQDPRKTLYSWSEPDANKSIFELHLGLNLK